MAGGRLVEQPPRSRRRKVPLPPSEHRPRPDAVDEPNRVVKVEPESILVPVRPGERLHRAPVADPLSLALDDHDLVAALEVDHDPRPDRDVARFLRLPIAAEPHGPLKPQPPHRHGVGPTSFACGDDPVAARGRQALLGPRPRQEALLNGSDAVARRHRRTRRSRFVHRSPRTIIRPRPRPIGERGYSPWPTWTSPSARLRIEEAGKRRWPPRVRECGSFPSLAHRVTVFGDTCRMSATSAVFRYSAGFGCAIAPSISSTSFFELPGLLGSIRRPACLGMPVWIGQAGRVCPTCQVLKQRAGPRGPAPGPTYGASERSGLSLGGQSAAPVIREHDLG